MVVVHIIARCFFFFIGCRRNKYYLLLLYDDDDALVVALVEAVAVCRSFIVVFNGGRSDVDGDVGDAGADTFDEGPAESWDSFFFRNFSPQKASKCFIFHGSTWAFSFSASNLRLICFSGVNSPNFVNKFSYKN